MKPTKETIGCLVLIYFISDAYGCRFVPETNKKKYCRSTIGTSEKVRKEVSNVTFHYIDYVLILNNSNLETLLKASIPSYVYIGYGINAVSCGLITSKNKVGRDQFEYSWSRNYNFKFNVEEEIRIRAKRSSSMCGVDLQVGVEYFLTGYLKTRYGRTYIETNSCNWIDEWNNIPLATEIDMTYRNFTTCYS